MVRESLEGRGIRVVMHHHFHHKATCKGQETGKILFLEVVLYKCKDVHLASMTAAATTIS